MCVIIMNQSINENSVGKLYMVGAAAPRCCHFNGGAPTDAAAYEGNPPILDGGQYFTVARPMTRSIGNGPHTCESNELFLLSPMTKMLPSGTVNGPYEYCIGSSFNSFPRDVPLT